MADLNKTMDAVAELHKSHGVKQKVANFIHRLSTGWKPLGNIMAQTLV